MATYPDVAAALLEQVAAYRAGTLSLDALQGAIWQAADLIVDIEESEIRERLQAIEGQLELIAFTTDRDRLFAASLAPVDQLDVTLSRYLTDPR